MLIEYWTLNYIFAYVWIAIWLSYQLFIHACSESKFRENYFLQIFLWFQLPVWNVQTNLFFGPYVRSSINRWSGSVPSGQVSNTSGCKPITFLDSCTLKHFFLDLSCHVVCVFSHIFFSEILAFSAYLFSFHCILFVFLCCFKLLYFLE
jgi:hypothetical protein